MSEEAPALPDRIGPQLLWGLLGVLAAGAAFVLLFLASFPYWFAESGSASYARAHRGEAVLQVVGATGFLWVAWQCFRRSFRPAIWMALGALVLAAAGLRGLMESRRPPAGVRPAGGEFHLVTVPKPGEIDTVYHELYYKQGSRYESVESMAIEPRFVPPDCMLYRGLEVVGHPMYAMCGYRIPVETYDTLTEESELLRMARGQPRFRVDWRVNR